jgi:hypothetical protein
MMATRHALTAISESRVVPPSLTSIEDRRAQHLRGQAQHSPQALHLDDIAHRLYALIRVDIRSHQLNSVRPGSRLALANFHKIETIDSPGSSHLTSKMKHNAGVSCRSSSVREVAQRWRRWFGQSDRVYKWKRGVHQAADLIAGSVAKYASSGV